MVVKEVIEANSVILSSKSQYFRAILSGDEWAESQTKVVEVEMDSQEGESITVRMIIVMMEMIVAIEGL